MKEKKLKLTYKCLIQKWKKKNIYGKDNKKLAGMILFLELIKNEFKNKINVL